MFKMRRRKQKFFLREPDKIDSNRYIRLKGKAKVKAERNTRPKYKVKMQLPSFKNNKKLKANYKPTKKNTTKD